MKYLFFVLLLCCSITYTNAQVKYETMESTILRETREIKIQLPRGYDANSDKVYPLFIVLDGDYLFEAVAGNVDYYTYWEDMPGAIVVGINQFEKRYDDCIYSEQNSLPIDKGAKFFEFIGMELLPHIEKKYKTGSFKVAVGHGDTANFINYFLLKPQPIFKAYIAISPELAPKMINYIPDVLSKIPSKTFYYLANTNHDSSSIKQMTDALNEDIATLDNKNLFYTFNNFEKPSHYSVPTHAIPNAIEAIFKVYQPISKEEYIETLLKLETSPVAYLEEKYKAINDLFGIKKHMLVNDFQAISATIEKTKNFEYYEALGKIARDEYPKTLLGNYYLARFYEEAGDSKKAMRAYQTAFSLDEIGGLTKDLMLEKADAIKADFGY